ncbi:CRISPR-associated endoribonuclease Cas6 [Myxacorys almedinensis]|uniref:CRISPR-associated endoribonuclease Cas6 n=1 Tax=Myxacorys almedinensis A TaxID=2690445 RepID=A0A8J7Z3G2_9CYAN|nr:CRISPR-associated endoribonuclease Cas6 [Myxacorys almedinensis]NDJ19044.1 CRISPR-associated endoribonuclease Cas6 [Myxacorys almedinensis A]
MPHSLVLQLQPQSPIPASHLSGRHLHALFLDLVRSQDPTLSKALHTQTSEKSFTLSALQTKSRDSGLQYQHDHAIAAGTPCWWRISLLDDALFGKLAPLWLTLNSQQPWHLGAAEITVTSVLGTPQPRQPWAGFATYPQMVEEASDRDRQVKFLFCTPTTFRQAKYDSALPTRDLVFQSLLRRWNQYSEIVFLEAIIEAIFPSFFDIRTDIVIDSRSKFIGCVGEVTFQILGDVEAQTIRQINTLADFALYAGVGRKTPMGMGMVRRRRK